MMFDFPKALREHGAYADKGLHRGDSEGESGDPSGCSLCLRAADEIEQLQAERDALLESLRLSIPLSQDGEVLDYRDFQKPGPVARDPLTEAWKPR